MARKKLEKQEKFRRRQDQNRKAQARCRQKKMDTINGLEMQLNKLQCFIDTHCDPVVFQKWMAESKPDMEPRSIASGSECSMGSMGSSFESSGSSGSSFDIPSPSNDDYQPQNSKYLVSFQPYTPPSLPAQTTPAEVISVINALGCPKDVSSYAQPEYRFQTPVIRRPQPQLPTHTMLTPGQMFVGPYQLGHLLNPNTGITPSVTRAFQMVFAPPVKMDDDGPKIDVTN